MDERVLACDRLFPQHAIIYGNITPTKCDICGRAVTRIANCKKYREQAEKNRLNFKTSAGE
jgi:hypothetical protein